MEGAHSTFLQFALEKLRQKKEFNAFADQNLERRKSALVARECLISEATCDPSQRIDVCVCV